jgi:hypothetical protein
MCLPETTTKPLDVQVDSLKAGSFRNRGELLVRIRSQEQPNQRISINFKVNDKTIIFIQVTRGVRANTVHHNIDTFIILLTELN